MREHLSAPLTLMDIARHAGASASALTRLFQEHRDTTPMNALRALRLDTARQKLKSDAGASVTEVALGVGFGTWAGFRSITGSGSGNCRGRRGGFECQGRMPGLDAGFAGRWVTRAWRLNSCLVLGALHPSYGPTFRTPPVQRIRAARRLQAP